ncbi:DUF1127 domain-containing protein [Tabrizicola piscis]|uniref:DUF1127 domain-containing protein n=1 Tax=Tabrizicola piscis TaxID=2494374 RepID=A0A3S8U2F9_9RHOB|nr:DUF1127 domain-containing protein [Tabrizicola piscis]AZL57709.1 DUF1127 domain-containing protein [Tabrizicola piscis]
MPRTQTKALPLRRPLTRIENPVARLLAIVNAALTRRRDRALLARLDSHLLRDIGIDLEQAAQESAKPFWRP